MGAAAAAEGGWRDGTDGVGCFGTGEEALTGREAGTVALVDSFGLMDRSPSLAMTVLLRSSIRLETEARCLAVKELSGRDLGWCLATACEAALALLSGLLMAIVEKDDVSELTEGLGLGCARRAVWALADTVSGFEGQRRRDRDCLIVVRKEDMIAVFFSMEKKIESWRGGDSISSIWQIQRRTVE